jgi:hypothetical protein
LLQRISGCRRRNPRIQQNYKLSANTLVVLE